MKKSLKTLIITFSIIIFIGCFVLVTWNCFFDPRRDEVYDFATTPDLYQTFTQKMAEDDLTYLYNKIKSHHPLWLEKTEKAKQLQKTVDSIYKNELAIFAQKTALNKPITTIDIYASCAKIVASMHDGHTRVWTNCSSNKLIHDITQFRQSEIYGELTAINDVPIETIFADFCKIHTHENIASAKQGFVTFPLYEESLLALGFDLSNGIDFTYTKDGISKVFHYNLVSGSEVIDPLDSVGKQNMPQSDWVYFEIFAEQNYGIFTLKDCTVDEHYLETLKNFFDEVLQNHITNVVVDLRGNPGGDSWVANEFLKYIDVDEYDGWDCAVRYGPYLHKNKNITHKNNKVQAPFNGKIFVFTDIYSYSSAMDFAMLIKDNNLGVLIGEPSGNKPCGYGDCLYFQTPNAKLLLSVSFKKWYRVDMSQNQDLLEVDYECDPAKCIEELQKLL